MRKLVSIGPIYFSFYFTPNWYPSPANSIVGTVRSERMNTTRVEMTESKPNVNNMRDITYIREKKVPKSHRRIPIRIWRNNGNICSIPPPTHTNPNPSNYLENPIRCFLSFPIYSYMAETKSRSWAFVRFFFFLTFLPCSHLLLCPLGLRLFRFNYIEEKSQWRHTLIDSIYRSLSRDIFCTLCRCLLLSFTAFYWYW